MPLLTTVHPQSSPVQLPSQAGYHATATPPAKTVYMTPATTLFPASKVLPARVSYVPTPTSPPPSFAPSTQAIFPQPSPPTNTGYPPACPAGTQWDDGSSSCLPYGYSTVDPTAGSTAACPDGTTLDPVSGMCQPSTSSAGPSIATSPTYVAPVPTSGLSTGAMWAIGLIAVGIVGFGALAFFRRR